MQPRPGITNGKGKNIMSQVLIHSRLYFDLRVKFQQSYTAKNDIFIKIYQSLTLNFCFFFSLLFALALSMMKSYSTSNLY